MNSFSQHYGFKSGWNVRFILKRVHGCRFLHFTSLFSMRASSILTHTHTSIWNKIQIQAIIHIHSLSHFTHYAYSVYRWHQNPLHHLEWQNTKAKRQNTKYVLYLFLCYLFIAVFIPYTLQVSIFPFVTYSYPWISRTAAIESHSFSLSLSLFFAVCVWLFVPALVIIVVMFLLRQNVLLFKCIFPFYFIVLKLMQSLFSCWYRKCFNVSIQSFWVFFYTINAWNSFVV